MSPPSYEVTPLPFFIPFSNAGGEALSNNGVVAGGVTHADGTVSLAQWCNGVLTELGAPPGLPNHAFNSPRIFGISNSGAIVGTVHTQAGDLPSRWFIYDGGRFNVLPLADPSDLGGAAIGINDRGEVVGYDRTASNNTAGWLWSKGSYYRLPVSGTNTVALGINSSGTIIGYRSLGFVRRLLTGQFRATGDRGYILSRDTTRYLTGIVYAINDFGEAVGASTADGMRVATVFRHGTETSILSLPSSAVGINSSGNVVGSYQPAGYDQRHLFIWNPDSGALDLTPDGYRGAEAAAINERGEILGFGETLSGKSQYFLLTPTPNGALTPKAITAPAATLSG
jgi:uncharacterized membrane protein